MRSLVIVPNLVGNASGPQLRYRLVVEALARRGEVDLVLLAVPPDLTCPPGDDEVRELVLGALDPSVRGRVGSVRVTAPADQVRSRRNWIPWWLGRRSGDDGDLAGVRHEVARMAESVDLVWAYKVFMLGVVPRSARRKTVVDFDDMLSTMCFRETRLWARRRPRAALRQALSGLVWMAVEAVAVRGLAAAVATTDQRRYRRFVPRMSIVPNGYRDPGDVERPAPEQVPVLLFVGALAYGPNREAARRLIDEIAPLVRRRWGRPVQVRIVGPDPGDLAERHDGVDVVVTGRVPDMSPELLRADVLVVAMSNAGGTRLKIIEAFAWKLPVVATVVAAEGLGAVADTHLLVGRSDTELADACVRLLSDPMLGARLASRARAHFLEQLDQSVMERSIIEVLEVVGRKNAAVAGALETPWRTPRE